MSARRLTRLIQLDAAERAVLVRAWALFVVVDLALRLLPFARVLALLGTGPTRGPESGAREPSLPRLVRLVEVAGRWAPVEPTCLKTALVLSRLLRRRGIATTLRIGVSRRDGTLAAHAWLEQDGRVIGGLTSGDGYEPLFSAIVGRSAG